MINDYKDSLLVIGSGAMACLFAARLAASGIQVTLLDSWAEGIEILKRQGVTLETSDGRKATYPVTATCDPQQCRGAMAALVLVKSWQTEGAARQLAACLSNDGVALTLQNGLGNREILAQVLGDDCVAQGVTTLGAYLSAPGVVRMAGEGTITLGDHLRIGLISSLLQKAGFEVEISSNTESLLWGKLVINAAVNPLTALLEIPNSALLERPHVRSLMAQAVQEAAAVAEAQGIRLPFSNLVETVENIVLKTAQNHSSMFQDIQRGAPTEIDAICGAVVQAGEKVGVETPLIRFLWQIIKAKVE
ncbi:MAG: 2-dehydropantoate 2-reductase [Anaerolineales bacterium]|nr:2-dehydropantoate 2-reductase [Anaerolineales bacterium]